MDGEPSFEFQRAGEVLVWKIFLPTRFFEIELINLVNVIDYFSGSGRPVSRSTQSTWLWAIIFRVFSKNNLDRVIRCGMSSRRMQAKDFNFYNVNSGSFLNRSKFHFLRLQSGDDWRHVGWIFCAIAKLKSVRRMSPGPSKAPFVIFAESFTILLQSRPTASRLNSFCNDLTLGSPLDPIRCPVGGQVVENDECGNREQTRMALR